MGASSSPWVERWSSVYTNLSQHGSLKVPGGACTPPSGGRNELPHELPSPAHWGGRDSPPFRPNGSDGNVSPGTFSEVKQMLDAAIAAGDAAADGEVDDNIIEEREDDVGERKN